MSIGLQAYLQGYMHEKTSARKPGTGIGAAPRPPITMSPAPTGKERVAARDEYLERNRINNYTENLATKEKFPGWALGSSNFIPGSDPSEARFKYDRARLFRDPEAYEKHKRRWQPSGRELPGYRGRGVPSLETRTTAGLEQPRTRFGAYKPPVDNDAVRRWGTFTMDDIKRMYPQK